MLDQAARSPVPVVVEEARPEDGEHGRQDRERRVLDQLDRAFPEQRVGQDGREVGGRHPRDDGDAQNDGQPFAPMVVGPRTPGALQPDRHHEGDHRPHHEHAGAETGHGPSLS